MKDLIKRLERLEGPDRDLDADIEAAIGGGEVGWRQTQYTGESVPYVKRPNPNYVGGIQKAAVPAYTGSIDAAFSIVPVIEAPDTPAKSWPATVDLRRHDDGSASASIRSCDATPDGAEDQLFAEATAATPAIAITIAALKART